MNHVKLKKEVGNEMVTVFFFDTSPKHGVEFHLGNFFLLKDVKLKKVLLFVNMEI